MALCQVEGFDPRLILVALIPLGCSLLVSNELENKEPFHPTSTDAGPSPDSWTPSDTAVPSDTNDQDSTDASEPDSSHPLLRVTKDLLVLYEFLEGSGTVVKDTSGTNTPLDLEFSSLSSENSPEWLPTGGLRIHEPSTITSSNAASRINFACRESNEITVETWIEPENLTQAGPARIVAISGNRSSHNVMLGQVADAVQVRFQTTNHLNGFPALLSDPEVLTGTLNHIVYVRTSDGQARLVINGEEKANREVSGDLSPWQTSYRLALANEVSNDRPWLGSLYLVAMYSRALTTTEIDTNFAAGVPKRP